MCADKIKYDKVIMCKSELHLKFIQSIMGNKDIQTNHEYLRRNNIMQEAVYNSWIRYDYRFIIGNLRGEMYI